jgi:hypothetical protein
LLERDGGEVIQVAVGFDYNRFGFHGQLGMIGKKNS